MAQYLPSNRDPRFGASECNVIDANSADETNRRWAIPIGGRRDRRIVLVVVGMVDGKNVKFERQLVVFRYVQRIEEGYVAGAARRAEDDFVRDDGRIVSNLNWRTAPCLIGEVLVGIRRGETFERATRRP